MARILKGYLTLLERYPWRTQMISTGILMGTGDVIAQFAVERKPLRDYEFTRTSRFFIFGTFVAGPALRSWYMFLERTIRLTGTRGALAKVVVDQSVFAPSFSAFFLTTMGYWRTRSVEATKEMLQEAYLDVLKANYKLWPAAQVITFSLIPLQHRVMFVNFVALIWNTFLAWRSEKSNQRASAQLAAPSSGPLSQSEAS